MKSIEEYTEYLFNCCFADDSFDPEGHEEHLETSWELFDKFSWDDIYPVLMHHLHSKCPTPADVINFVNLYFYYGIVDRPIADPIEFISYLYYMVDMDIFWDDAGELFDGLAISILTKCRLMNVMENPYYSPLKDDRILTGISNWKTGKFSAPCGL